MIKLINKLWNDEAGTSAVEYGLLAALVAIAAVSMMGETGTELSATFEQVKDELNP